jgi:hypothetical protein
MLARNSRRAHVLVIHISGPEGALESAKTFATQTVEFQFGKT